MIGRVLEKYQILDKVGQGGMAVVYRGVDTTLGREVAIKVLHPHLAAIEESRLRLQREAQAVAKLHHENILEIFAYSGLESPESYIVTEFIHGQTLKDFLKDHTIPLPEIAAMMVHEICRALEHAHSFGIIHRDVKPENIMIRKDGLLKLTDFGIAQVVDKQRMTVTGQLLGSPAYMAPEQVEGKSADFRTDVFAVGILLYQLATGDLPFRGKNPHEVLKKIVDCKFLDPAVARPEVGAHLSRIIVRALAREPEARYPEVGEMLAELRGYLEESGVKEPRPELQAFFDDPTGHAERFRPQLIATLTTRGEQTLAAGRTPRALELFNRVLTLEPGNARVERAIKRLSRRRLATRSLAYAAVAVAVVGGVLGAVRLWPRAVVRPVAAARDASAARAAAVDAGAASSQPAAEDAAPAATGREAAGLAARPGAPARPAPPLDHLPRVRKPPLGPAPVAAATRTVSLVVLPASAAPTVSLDRRPLGRYQPGQKIAVGPGAHELVVSAPAFLNYTIKLDPGDTRPSITVPLRWKPAVVLVKCNAPGAFVTVRAGGRNFTGEPGAVITVPVPSNSTTGEFIAEVAVSAAGFRRAGSTESLTAGRSREVTFTLKRAE
jgi:serine/threonine-protein kinase